MGTPHARGQRPDQWLPGPPEAPKLFCPTVTVSKSPAASYPSKMPTRSATLSSPTCKPSSPPASPLRADLTVPPAHPPPSPPSICPPRPPPSQAMELAPGKILSSPPRRRQHPRRRLVQASPRHRYRPHGLRLPLTTASTPPNEKIDLKYYYGGIKACAAVYDLLSQKIENKSRISHLFSTVQ